MWYLILSKKWTPGVKMWKNHVRWIWRMTQNIPVMLMKALPYIKSKAVQTFSYSNTILNYSFFLDDFLKFLFYKLPFGKSNFPNFQIWLQQFIIIFFVNPPYENHYILGCRSSLDPLGEVHLTHSIIFSYLHYCRVPISHVK